MSFAKGNLSRANLVRKVKGWHFSRCLPRVPIMVGGHAIRPREYEAERQAPRHEPSGCSFVPALESSHEGEQLPSTITTVVAARMPNELAADFRRQAARFGLTRSEALAALVAGAVAVDGPASEQKEQQR